MLDEIDQYKMLQNKKKTTMIATLGFFRCFSMKYDNFFWNFSLNINPQIRRSDISRYIHIYSNKCKYKICALANAQCVCTFKVSTYVCTWTNRTFCGDFKCKSYFNLTIFFTTGVQQGYYIVICKIISTDIAGSCFLMFSRKKICIISNM